MKLNRIRIVLKEKGNSQTWLSEKLGKSFSTVNSYVCNRSQLNLTTLLEISKLLSVDMKIDQHLADLQSEIDYLKEFKQRLISDAVTGKICVAEQQKGESQ